MSNLTHVLDVVLEDDSTTTYNSIHAANSLVKELEATKQKIHDLQHQLVTAHNRMCGELALTIRRRMPGLSVGVSRDGCKIGYRTKHLILQPDSRRGVWSVKSADSRFSRRFISRHSSKTIITPDFAPLIDALVTHFVEHYKTLGEDIIGTGVILIEDRRGSLTDLAQWYESQIIHKKLNSRLVRLG